MGLADEIRAVRDRALTELVAAHDYFRDSAFAWDAIESSIEDGETFLYRNDVTGTTTTQADLGARAASYMTNQVAQATFQQFVSIFESFFFDLLTLWLVAFPQSLGKRTVEFRTILYQPDRDELIRLIVRRELNEVAFERPAEWFVYLEGRVRLGVPVADDIARIAEAKASRDVLVHNRGIVNKTYVAKSGGLARHAVDDPLDITEPYHRATWDLFKQVVADLGTALAARAT